MRNVGISIGIHHDSMPPSDYGVPDSLTIRSAFLSYPSFFLAVTNVVQLDHSWQLEPRILENP